MDLSQADIVVCKFCEGFLRPVPGRQAPPGFKFFRCDDCGGPNVLPDDRIKAFVR